MCDRSGGIVAPVQQNNTFGPAVAKKATVPLVGRAAGWIIDPVHRHNTVSDSSAELETNKVRFHFLRRKQ